MEVTFLLEKLFKQLDKKQKKQPQAKSEIMLQLAGKTPGVFFGLVPQNLLRFSIRQISP